MSEGLTLYTSGRNGQADHQGLIPKEARQTQRPDPMTDKRHQAAIGQAADTLGQADPNMWVDLLGLLLQNLDDYTVSEDEALARDLQDGHCRSGIAELMDMVHA